MTTLQTSTTPAMRTLNEVVPPLEFGDRLTRAEFERRWDAMPHLKHAELINGVVHMAAALRVDKHGEPHADLLGWLSYYSAKTPGVRVADNASDRLDEDNMPQPDALMRILTEAGGQARVADDGILEGPPELSAEIAASTASYDLHDKLNVYRRHGVKEYIVWRVLDNAIDWFVLNEGRYDRLEPVDIGGATVHQSRVFPGLWLDTSALLRSNLAAVFAVVDQGFATDEHKAFVTQLAEKMEASK